MHAKDSQTLLNWSGITTAPDGPGIYAWYFKPELTEFDIKELINSLQMLTNQDCSVSRTSLVRSFLRVRLFQYFEQKPYTVEIKGQLKPRYKGQIDHQAEEDLSEAIIGRITENPESLYELRLAIERTTPLFASPLYIGMAENLRRRLTSHKRLILELNTTETVNSLRYINYTLPTAEINFAERVVERKIPVSRLFVAVEKLDSAELANNVENLLNRIYFPILGRN